MMCKILDSQIKIACYFSSRSNALSIPLPHVSQIPPTISYQSRSHCTHISIPVCSPTMIISNICKFRPDHYKVTFVDGRIHIGGLVQDYQWHGMLGVLRSVAENEEEIIIECVGRDRSDRRIVRFLVVEKSWLDRSPELEVGFWNRMGFHRLPRALDSEWYLPRDRLGVEVLSPWSLNPFIDFVPSSFSMYFCLCGVPSHRI